MPPFRPNQSRFSPGVVASFTALLILALSGSLRAQDSDWPRQFGSSSGTFVIYEPQPEEVSGDLLTGRVAFSLQKSDSTTPAFGVLWFTERIAIDRDSLTVSARAFDVTRVRLPGITPDEAGRYEKLVEKEATGWDLSGSLQSLQSGLAASEKERASVADLDTLPPRIVFAYQRAVLVSYDGEPILEPIDQSSLQRVANTPYAIVYDPAAGDFYLNGANLWYSARDAMGPWARIQDPPRQVRAAVPPDTSSSDQVQGPAPVVLTATEPTELISMDGPAQYAPLVEGKLEYVTNTESDVIRDVGTKEIYVLLAGRWFRATSTDGPWTFVSGDALPESFGQIPADSPKGNVLASVAGTDEADDGLADAEIPQTSPIRRSASGFQVIYDGDPQFEAIAGTNLEYAVNTDAQVLRVDREYYACSQGVWYVSDSPNGPWRVSDTRPEGLDDIPPSCPVYDVRYVYIYDATPDVVYDGYLPGYFGCYPYRGTVVYGTGYRYRPWRGKHRYYARPCTWGFHPHYNPWLSRWSFGFSYGSGFFRVGFRWRIGGGSNASYEPPLWFGPGGYHRPLVDKDMALLRARPARNRLAGWDRAPSNIYTRSENIARVDKTASRIPGRSRLRATTQPVRIPNNVFAGRDGKVYQRDDSGNWKVNQGSGWVATPTPMVPSAPPVPVTGATESRGNAGGGNAGGGGRFQPGMRQQPRPLPVQVPTAPRTQPPAVTPSPRPNPPAVTPAPYTPPVISQAPGNLENEFRARRRADQSINPRTAPPVVRPAPAPTPPAQSPPAQVAPSNPSPSPKPDRPSRSPDGREKDKGDGGRKR